ncbi:MAG TPA: type IV pilus twitching motility protein PilT [Candidatus Krumholzibacteria bacterium]|nr:type IV pilus twitching motility protein PilT [Candidatus Krumholzibacteria bacterium]HPD71456.1 type IV pilus twitching motility protein PilT [Candidatus Krumholzibacteria bacterium]HRY41611.1 type IV pilus twitching motility protein PilT [Candidatus Krumholzibacteria bacterium]
MTGMREMLEEMVARGASDLHLTAGLPPQYRVDGLVVGSQFDVLNGEDTRRLAYSILNEEQKKRFENDKELDFSFGVQGISRFRANVFMQRGVTSMAIRQIPYTIHSFEELGLPRVCRELINRTQGLILVTGPTGSGKSTTLATMVDTINQSRNGHIITIEDPIEYVHQHKKCIVNQREVNNDTKTFAQALKYVLRQDPDVILIGEMRDRETIGAALTIAETGHLALATLHTNSTFESINRIVDVFPPEQQNQVRSQLSFTLAGVLTQQLIPRAKSGGRVLALEIMVCTPAIKSMIRDNKIHQIYGHMQAGQKHGMQTMNQSLYQAVENRWITLDTAMGRSPDQQELMQMLGEPVGGAK